MWNNMKKMQHLKTRVRAVIILPLPCSGVVLPVQMKGFRIHVMFYGAILPKEQWGNLKLDSLFFFLAINIVSVQGGSILRLWHLQSEQLLVGCRGPLYKWKRDNSMFYTIGLEGILQPIEIFLWRPTTPTYHLPQCECQIEERLSLGLNFSLIPWSSECFNMPPLRSGNVSIEFIQCNNT